MPECRSKHLSVAVADDECTYTAKVINESPDLKLASFWRITSRKPLALGFLKEKTNQSLLIIAENLQAGAIFLFVNFMRDTSHLSF